MEKIEIEVTKEELEILKKEMHKNPKEKVRNKARVIYLRHEGCTEKEIIQKTEISLHTILEYVKAFKANGIDSIYKTNYKPQPSKLEPYANEIITEFEKNPPSSRAHAVEIIKEKWGVDTSITAVGKFLKKKGCPIGRQKAYQQKQIKKNNKSF